MWYKNWLGSAKRDPLHCAFVSSCSKVSSDEKTTYRTSDRSKVFEIVMHECSRKSHLFSSWRGTPRRRKKVGWESCGKLEYVRILQGRIGKSAQVAPNRFRIGKHTGRQFATTLEKEQIPTSGSHVSCGHCGQRKSIRSCKVDISVRLLSV